MVCIRCQMVEKAELEKFVLPYVYVKIGEADIVGEIQQEPLERRAKTSKFSFPPIGGKKI